MDHEQRAEIWGNIMLVGGGSMMRGISGRFFAELVKYTTLKLKVIAAPERFNSAWIGGSIVSSISQFERDCMTHQEYMELGLEQLLSKSLTQSA